MVNPDAYDQLLAKLKSEHFPIVKEILGRLTTPQEAEILLSLPATAPEIASKFGLDVSVAEAVLKTFVKKGLGVSFLKAGGTRYFFARSLGQLSDATAAAAFNRIYEPVPPDLLKLWAQHREVETIAWARRQSSPPPIRFRVIPLKAAAVKSELDLLPYEDTEQIVRNAPSIAVVNCPCRMYRVSQGLCDKPLEVCLQLTDGAVRYALDQGIGRTLTLEEGLQVLRLTEKAGLVPTTLGRDRIGFICHCDGDCCGNVTPVRKTGFPMVEKSRYEASLQKDLCTGCESCVERCNFGAIEIRPDPDTKELLATVDTEKCYGCGACVIECPANALSIHCVRPPEHIPAIAPGHAQV